MNLLLAFILSFVMVFSGNAQLPAQSADATEWTLSNVMIGAGNEYVRLDEQLVLTASACAGGVSLQMKILSGGQVMLPASAVLDGEKLLLSFGSGSNVYSFDNDMIMEFADLPEEDEALFADGTDFLMALGSIAARISDKEYMELIAGRITGAEDEKVLEEEKAAEVEIDGVLYPAVRRIREKSDADLMLELDRVDCTDLPELEMLLHSMARVLCSLEGIDPEKGYAGLAELCTSDPDMVRITASDQVTAEAEGMDYIASRSRVKDAEDNIISEQNGEYLGRDSDISARLHNTGTVDAETTSVDAEIGVEGPLDNPLSISAGGKYSVFTDYSYPVEKDGRETKFIRTMEDRVEFDFGASNNAGLWSGSLFLDIDKILDRGYESDRYRDQQSANVMIGCTENRIEGNLSRSFVLEAEDGFDTFYLSFDLLEKKVPYADPMEGLTLHEIDLAEEGMNPSALALMADAMSFSGNAMILSAQEDIMMAGMLLEELGYEDYEELESFEYACKYYGIDWPEYTPPAGYALDGIYDVQGHLGKMDVYYWSEAEQEGIIVSYEDFRGLVPYSGLDEAALKKGPILKADVVNGLINYIDVYTPEVHVRISTDGVRPETADALLKGLDIVSLYMDEDELAEYMESQKGKL